MCLRLRPRSQHQSNLRPNQWCLLGRGASKGAVLRFREGFQGPATCGTSGIWSVRLPPKLPLAANAANEGTKSPSSFVIHPATGAYLLPVMLVADFAPEPSVDMPAAGAKPFEFGEASEYQRRGPVGVVQLMRSTHMNRIHPPFDFLAPCRIVAWSYPIGMRVSTSPVGSRALPLGGGSSTGRPQMC